MTQEYHNINKPKHYNIHSSGIECIEITKYMPFCLGNAIKYIWRAGLKNDDVIEDYKKAIWYLKEQAGFNHHVNFLPEIMDKINTLCCYNDILSRVLIIYNRQEFKQFEKCTQIIYLLQNIINNLEKLKDNQCQ